MKENTLKELITIINKRAGSDNPTYCYYLESWGNLRQLQKKHGDGFTILSGYLKPSEMRVYLAGFLDAVSRYSGMILKGKGGENGL